MPDNTQTGSIQYREDNFDFIIDAELAIWDFNLLTNKFTGNNALKEWFGLSPAETITLETLLDRVADNDRERAVEEINTALNFSSGGNYNAEYTIINPVNSTAKNVVAKGKVLFDKNKNPYRFSGTIRDITKEKFADEKIRSAEKIFRDIVKQAPIGITIFSGPDFLVEMANDAYLQIVGRKESEFTGKPLFDVLPEVKSSIKSLLYDVYTTGNPFYGYEFPVTLNRYGKQELTYFDFVYHPLHDEQQNIYGIIVVASEVTAAVKAKHLLAESEKQFRNIIMQSPIPMAIFRGEDFVIEIANNIMFTQLWRKKPEDVLNKKLLDVFPELKEQKFPELLAEVYKTGKSYNEKESVAYVQGDNELKKFYLDFEYAPLFDIEGNVSGIFITVNDVTEKVEVRHIIEIAEERARLAVNAGELGVYDFDLKTKKLTADDRYFEIFGYESNANSDEILEILHPDDIEVRNAAYEHAYKTGVLDYEARFVKTNAAVIWIKVRGKIIFEDEVAVKILGLIVDITKQKEFEATLENKVQERTKELAEANLQLHQSNIELNQFAYIASHDLQEPLRKVRTFTELMVNDLGNISGKTKMYVDKIKSSTERMQTLINDVLKFSLLSKERKKFEEVDLDKVLKTVISDYELLIEQKQAHIETDNLPSIEAIPLQMNQLFTNLISNALKFGKKDALSKITVRSSVVDKEELQKHDDLVSGKTYYKIEFIDNGIGFNQENAEQIFTIFQRLHGKAEYEGTGIGLAMCKKIVQNHHGIIYADSVLNKGAIFTVILPKFQY